MGNRKRNSAEMRKEMRKSQYFAIMKNVPTSPRKMRLVADLIRGLDVTTAMGILQNSPKHASIPMSKLLRSAMANWESKNEGARIEESDLYVSQVNVDSARQLKRIRTAPQGRAHRIRKRSNHVTLFVAQRNQVEAEIEETTENTSN